MSPRLDPEVASSFGLLSPERRQQVLDYACWLRENKDDPIRRRPDSDPRCPPARATRPPASRGAPELEWAIQGLNCEQQGMIAEYVTALAANPPRGVPGHALLRFAGTIPEDSLRQMEQAIEEDFERIDYEEW
jgi:hypothetical protein